MNTPAETYEIMFYQEALVWARSVERIQENIHALLEHIALQQEREEITEEQKSYLHTIIYERFKD